MENMREVRKKERMVRGCMVVVVEEICSKTRIIAHSGTGEIAECKAEINDLGIRESFVVYQYPGSVRKEPFVHEQLQTDDIQASNPAHDSASFWEAW